MPVLPRRNFRRQAVHRHKRVAERAGYGDELLACPSAGLQQFQFEAFCQLDGLPARKIELLAWHDDYHAAVALPKPEGSNNRRLNRAGIRLG